ncbi:glycosyltransferase [Microbacterium sp. G2-8]|uniref:glycosyltransferase n=1 Tax=Microbacterium sp. G2-8 TaxID=2842454 RepID=UPI001C89F409|nr:glycosyltransferase [Microbacterium sp. G2-8]
MPFAPSDRRVFNYPGWRDNAYVQLLQAVAIERGFEPTGHTTFTETLVELTSPERRGVVHIQWPSPVTEDADDAVDARRRVDLFLDALRSAQRWGRPILWTIHNVLPHDTRFPRTAILLHSELAQIADAVHVLTAHTVEAARDTYEIPADKVIEIPHSSYAGVYGSPVSRTAARTELGFGDEKTGVLFFGWIRPYKGIGDLADAVTLASDHGADLEVMLAGRPLGAVQHDLARIDGAGATVTRHLRRVLDVDVPVWFSAADVLVLPYREMLNSGTMYLAATYGLPIILPDAPHLVDALGGEEWIRFFDRDDPAASMAALLEDPWFRSDAARGAARAFADAHTPRAMGEAYADLLERLVDAR